MQGIKRLTALTLTLLLMLFGAAWAQEGQQSQEQQDRQDASNTLEGKEFTPIGQIDVGEPEPYDTEEEQTEVTVETGAILFTGDTPDDQHPNVDLVGPDGFYEHFELDDSADAERVIDGLLPGVYSVAATDDGLQLVHTLVEVVAGQAVRVHLSLEQAANEFQPGTLTEPRTFPAQGFRAGDPRRIDDSQFGTFTVETDDEDARFVVTGPDNYSQEFTGGFTAETLMPGIYTIAATKEGSEIATTTVEVDISTARTLVPVITVTAETEEVEGDVAGGGDAGEQQEGQQDGEEQDSEEEQQQ